MLFYYEVQVTFPGWMHQSEAVATAEKLAGAEARTWGQIDKGGKFRVLFLADNYETAKQWAAKLSTTDGTKAGILEVRHHGKATSFPVEPFPFRIGTKVKAKSDVTCEYDEVTFAEAGETGVVVEHAGPHACRVKFEKDNPYHHAYFAENTQLQAVVPNVVIIE